jgi:TIR domain
MQRSIGAVREGHEESSYDLLLMAGSGDFVGHQAAGSGSTSSQGDLDVFISHASEDKDTVARPLSRALVARGWFVWLDELELTIGDSLSGRIDAALARSRFGVVVLSSQPQAHR